MATQTRSVTEVRPTRWAGVSSRYRSRLVGVAGVLIVALVYEWAATRPGANAALMPSLETIAGTGFELLREGVLLEHTLWSLRRVLIGFAIGGGLGVFLGMLIGWFWFARALLSPLIQGIRPIPPLAFIPLVILWFGIGETSKIIVIALGAFVTSVVTVAAGVRDVPSVYIEAAGSLGARNRHIFRYVLLPASLPYILTALRISLGVAWAVLVAAELIAAQKGLGFLLLNARRYIQTDVVIVAIATIGLIAMLMDSLLQWMEARVFRWRSVREK